MFTINLAGIKIRIDHKYEFVKRQCFDYIITDDSYDFAVSVSDEDLDTERKIGEPGLPDGYLESVCIYRAIASKLPEYNALLFHCAAIEFQGNAYCFTAKSGTGKTTHINLWRKTFGKDVKIINGDKPIIRFFDDEISVFGTPWCGKENLQRNVSAPLRSVCIIKQAPENKIVKLSNRDALNRLLHQFYFPKSKENAEKTISLLGKLLSSVSVWELECNISEEAAKTSFNALTKG